MDTPDNRNERQELRSEKVRKILGDIPPSLSRWSIAVIAIITSALAVAAYLYVSR